LSSRPATNHDCTTPQQHRLPNFEPPLAQLHQQDWLNNRQKVFANLVTLLQKEPRTDILLLQGWGDPVTGCPEGNCASALGPQRIGTKDTSKSSAIGRPPRVGQARHIVTASWLTIESLA